MATKKLTYKAAFDELEEILAKLGNDELNVDDLSEQVKKASELIKFCKGKLRDTETEIEKIMDEMENN